MFLSLDGVDGAGKTTQLKLLQQWLANAPREVVLCRDPGSTPLGEKIRDLLLHAHDLAISSRSEMLLYMAARAQLVEEVIRPALDRKKIVVADRYLLANVVYQGYAGGLDVETLWRIGETATAGLMPDVTIVLDLDPDAASGRMNREADRMELRGTEFQRRVRDGFLREAAKSPEKIVVIDASQPVELVHENIRRTLRPFLAKEGIELP